LALRAADGDLAVRMGRFDVVALIAVVGTALRALGDTVVAKAAAWPETRRSDELVAVTPLGELGGVVGIVGRSAEQVARTVRGLVADLPTLLGDDPWTRKW